ncbi:G-protein coupled receptor 110 [Camelus ferus]|nr:G-protein coupled receptor 110 [Camelus ferus]
MCAHIAVQSVGPSSRDGGVCVKFKAHPGSKMSGAPTLCSVLLASATCSNGPVQEYELLLQVAYRDAEEKIKLKKFLTALRPPFPWLPGPMRITRVKATTYCSDQNRALRCACEDGYSWFPPSCLDPQKCYLRMAGALPSCDCRVHNLTQSVYFCERTRPQQFRLRDGSIAVWYEVVGSSSTSELLSGIEQVAEEAKAGLRKLFPLQDDSFRVFGKGNPGIPVLRRENFSVIASNATEAAMSSLVQNLSIVLQQSPSTTAGNLASVVSILSDVLSLSLENHLRVTSLTVENVINIADHILNSTSVTNWTVLLQEEKNASSRLLQTLENISVLVPSTALPLNFTREFINWQGIPASPSQQKTGYIYETEMFSRNNSIPIRGHVLIKSDQFQGTLPETIISMASLTLGNILPITKNENVQVNGPVIATVIQNYSINEIFLNFSKMESNLSQPHCTFWDFSHLQWNNAGCHLVNETADSVTCRCTHLTSFSVLMSPFVPPSIVPAVKWVTFVGLGVSIGSLLLSLITEALFWKQVSKSQTSHTRHICMVNIALCLLIADVWFIVAATVDAMANPPGVCVAAVFFTHFFYLSLFFWMLMLAFLLAYRVILVFHHVATPWMVAVGFCLGYGCPLIISIITIAVTQPSNGYKRKDACWLDWSDGSKPLLAFAVPALTVVAVNLVVVLFVLTKLWRPTVGERLSQDHKATVVRVGRSLLVLTPLLGLTWGFGIGTMVDSRNPVWHIIFALLNAFQQNPSDVSTKPKFEKTFNPFRHKGCAAISGIKPPILASPALPPHNRWMDKKVKKFE